mgnify:FL=1
MINFLCTKIGGIWCYWPDFNLTKVILASVFIMIIIWILLNKRNKHKNHAGKNLKNLKP